MTKLIIADKRHFDVSVKNIFDPQLWSGYKYGLYDVTKQNDLTNKNDCSLLDRILIYYGLDMNIDTMKAPILMAMPFPVISVLEQNSEIIENEPKQLIQFDGTAITGDVLLKAIAIAQNPELAKDLL